MTFLPIVDRELRVAARRPGTYRTRWVAAVGMMALWAVLFAVNRRVSPAELNKILFVALGVLALGFCLFAGSYLTADCLSEEKREGTLGLLFLTDLRGYDVVLGKLIATSVSSVYGLLAMLPVLALPMMMGGVTVGEYWRVALVLTATLFLSLSMGMFVSAAVREARQAMAGTLLGLVALAGLPPTLWWLGYLLFRTRAPAVVMWPSPVSAFGAALDTAYRGLNGPFDFWMSLATISCVSLGLLVVAALRLPHAWEERASGARAADSNVAPNGTCSPSSERRSARVAQLLETNPYQWLASRTRSFESLGRALLGLLMVIWFFCLVASVVRIDGKWAFVVCLLTAYAVHQAGKYLVALEAARQFSEDRRSGALELLLITPLPEAQILSGQKRALQRRSRGLRRLLLGVNVCMCLAVMTRSESLKMSPRDQAVFVEIFLGGTLVLWADFRALQTVGMWRALRAGRQHRAVLGTMGRVMLVPWAGVFLLVFLTYLTRTLSGSEGEVAVVLALWFLTGILTDLIVAAWARAKLGRGLRYWVAGAEAGGRQRSHSPESSTLVALTA